MEICANTLLCSCCSAVGALIKSQENVFELIHPCIRKQQGRIISGHYRARWDNLVALAGKEIQVGLANLGDFHVNNYRIGPNLGQTLESGL